MQGLGEAKMKTNWTKMVVAVMAAQALGVLSASGGRGPGGSIANGETLIGTIAVTNGTDSWTFFANPGDAIVVRVGEIASTLFDPKIQLLSPTSELLGTATGSSAAEIATSATTTGTYTIVVS